ncbi:MAG TPA: helix-hairpin-helix domain-containing protein [Fibrobacteraceae bacterium]|nr:helix-hairpin-helix domain-containing protein [Fibrobacteraceae bacterium]
MNAAERRTLLLALVMLLAGWTARALPSSLCDGCGDLMLAQANPVPKTDVLESVSERTSLSSSSGVVPPQKARRSGETAQAPKALHINTATAQDLQKLKGIGPALAKRILEERGRIGRFRGPEDLDKVRGIGRKTLDNLLPFLIFD